MIKCPNCHYEFNADQVEALERIAVALEDGQTNLCTIMNILYRNYPPEQEQPDTPEVKDSGVQIPANAQQG